MFFNPGQWMPISAVNLRRLTAPQDLHRELVIRQLSLKNYVELGLLRQRAREAFEQKARRGFAMWEVQVGFIRTDEGRIRQRISQVPTTGKCSSSCDLVPGRANPGAQDQNRNCRSGDSLGVAELRKNPSDAEQPVLCRSVRLWQDWNAHGDRAGASAATLAFPEPHEEWRVLLVDHHPGYISWQEYLENRRRLEANVAWSDSEGSGAAKLGAALLSGLLALWSMRTENASCL
jgi:hypothetical protein